MKQVKLLAMWGGGIALFFWWLSNNLEPRNPEYYSYPNSVYCVQPANGGVVCGARR